MSQRLRILIPHDRLLFLAFAFLLQLVVVPALVLLVPSLSSADSPKAPPADANLPDVPGLADDYQVRFGLDNSRIKFTRDKSGVVAYVGGSITAAQGWSQLVDAELKKRFPTTKFSLVHAGIPSIDSSGHAFRLMRDVLQKGVPDLIFVEAAVNDLHNSREEIERMRAMEGIVRRAIKLNRFVDIVFLHFAEPRHTADYERGQTPDVIASHEKIAVHYQIPSVNLAHEVQRRMKAGQFDWARDFKDLHPSPFGHHLYFQAVKRLFDRAWDKPLASDATERERPLGQAIDRNCYDAGTLEQVNFAQDLRGFRIEPNWRATDKAATRDGFVGVPMLIGERPGDRFTYAFEGRGIGFFFTAGPDTGIVEYRVDGGPWKRRDTLTQWSKGLHLPWVLMLEAELDSKPHVLEVRMADPPAGRGASLRIRDILVNGPAYDLPPSEELTVRSTLDGTMQPSLLCVPPAVKQNPKTPAPLLVYLHSWSGDYRQDNSAWQAQAVERGWIYLHPNFRGINKQPQACGSKFARQDILDAIDVVASRYNVDRDRIYIAGTSGGGHMAMLMAGYFPERFSAVSAWVGISDLADWYRFHVKGGQPDHYAQMTADSTGGPPGTSSAVDEEYRSRSPLYFLKRVGDLPVELAAGVKDGKTGSVPIRHSLLAFNEIAKSQGKPTIGDADIATLWDKGSLTQPQPSDQLSDPTYGRRIFLRRNAGRARVTIFDGGHEGLARPACEWLARQKRTTSKP